MYLTNQKGSFTVPVEDRDIPGVFAHYAECYTEKEARHIGLLLKADLGTNVYIQKTERL